MSVSAKDRWPLSGGCQCGRNRYQLLREPLGVGLCHCRSCRLATGATPVAWAVMRDEDVTFEGETATSSSSPGVARGFCGRCGTTLTFRDNAEMVDVTIATLDTPDALRPKREIWLEDAVTWAAVDRHRACFARRSKDGPPLQDSRP